MFVNLDSDSAVLSNIKMYGKSSKILNTQDSYKKGQMANRADPNTTASSLQGILTCIFRVNQNRKRNVQHFRTFTVVNCISYCVSTGFFAFQEPHSMMVLI